MAWVYQTKRSRDWVRVIGKGNHRYRNYGIWIHPNGHTLSQIYGISRANIWPGTKVPLNTWTHLAASTSNAQMEVPKGMLSEHSSRIGGGRRRAEAADPCRLELSLAAFRLERRVG